MERDHEAEMAGGHELDAVRCTWIVQPDLEGSDWRCLRGHWRHGGLVSFNGLQNLSLFFIFLQLLRTELIAIVQCTRWWCGCQLSALVETT